MTVKIFPGTDGERDALLAAVGRDCACTPAAGAEKAGATCPAHTLLLDEAALKHLIFYRRWQSALVRGERLEPPDWSARHQQ